MPNTSADLRTDQSIRPVCRTPFIQVSLNVTGSGVTLQMIALLTCSLVIGALVGILIQAGGANEDLMEYFNLQFVHAAPTRVAAVRRSVWICRSRSIIAFAIRKRQRTKRYYLLEDPITRLL
jgi:hypothetical protein